MAQRTPVTIDDQIDEDRIGPIEQPGGDTKSKGDIPTVSGFELHSPAEFIDGGTDSDGSYGNAPRRRGRKPGSKNRASTETKAPHNLADGIEKLLLSVHAMGSVFLHCPELELDPIEAKLMASSIRDLSKHYQVTLDPKRLAMIEFSTVMASIYGLRGVAIYKRLKSDSKKRPTVVTPINREQSKQATASGTAAPPKPAESKLATPADYFGPDNGVEDLSQL